MKLHYENDLGLKPLEVVVREGEFDSAVKIFKMMVQKDGVLNLYRHRDMGYEKPSVKKRRKTREALNRKFIADLREAQMASGEWDARQKKKEQKKVEKQQKRTQKMSDHSGIIQ